MRELIELLEQGQILMREIREALDKPKGVIARPGMKIKTNYNTSEYVVISWEAYKRRYRECYGPKSGCPFPGKVPFIKKDFNVGHDLYESILTLGGIPIIGYADDCVCAAKHEDDA